MTLRVFKTKKSLKLTDLIALLEKKNTTTDHRGFFIRAALGDAAGDEEDAAEGEVTARRAARATRPATEATPLTHRCFHLFMHCVIHPCHNSH